MQKRMSGKERQSLVMAVVVLESYATAGHQRRGCVRVCRRQLGGRCVTRLYKEETP